MLPSRPDAKAYWNIGAPPEYLTAVGAVIAHWGYFEAQFDACIGIISRPPAVRHLVAKGLPTSFKRRAKIMRDMARITFSTAPGLAAKILDFSHRSHLTSQKRNVLVHGLWFDHGSFDPDLGVTIDTKHDGTGDYYSVRLCQIEALAEKIAALRLEAILTFFPPVPGRENPHLKADELDALRQYHEDFPPIPPAPHDPSRKGTAPQPTPFQA
jgi:hypothetical protein